MPWSLSQYSLYKKCPSAYDFRHNKKIPDPAGPAAQRGTNVHAQLEYYLATGEWSGGIRQYTKDKAELMRKEGYKAELKLALNDKWEPVDWKSEQAWVRGVIDAVKFGPIIRMGEWKTGKVWDDHEAQRRLYLCMVLSAHTEAEAAEIDTIYADQDHAQGSALIRKDLPEAQQYWLENVTPMLQDTFFSPRPGGHCNWCAYSKRKGGPCSVA
jgi:PD-(D/E)XK nuclease superfamily